MSSCKIKIRYPLWLLVGYSSVTRWFLVIIKQLQALILKKSSVLHKMMLICHASSAQFMEWHNLAITTVKPVIGALNVFFKFATKLTINFICSSSSKFVTLLTEMIQTNWIPWRIYENSEMVHFAETNQAPFTTQCCSILEE